MAYRLEPFDDIPLTPALVGALLDEHARAALPRLMLAWHYYRNAAEPGCGSSASALAQAAGLPARLTGRPRGAAPVSPHLTSTAAAEREIVIENDIAWRIHTMIEFMFGRPLRLISGAPDPERARVIERVLEAVWEASGGIALLQDLALLGHVYGHVDLLLRAAPDVPRTSVPPSTDTAPDLAAESLRIEAVEPTRAVPLVNASDYRVLDAYIIHHQRTLPAAASPTDAPLSRWMRTLRAGHFTSTAPRRRAQLVTEIISATHRQVYLTAAGPDSSGDPWLELDEPLPFNLGRPPVVHIQNLSQPFSYAGLGEVEPLIPLQDELNTRLSDRASRVTMQSFKMYLAKGLDGFDKAPIGPGQLWSTDNPDASIESFGGDAASPSEDRHIEDIREALDKISGVPPLATGVVRARVGNLTSENALRITLTGLLSRTARKRVTYGRGLAEMSGLVLAALDQLGIFRTDPSERTVRVEWPDPLPKDERDQLAAAKTKLDLGVPRDRLLAELGYAAADPGVV
jgi:hypothetical protein